MKNTFYFADGAELLDAEGNVIDGPAFVATLKVIKTIP